MDILNGNTFCQALELCDSFSDANIGIIMKNSRSVDEFAEAIFSEICSGRMSGWNINKGIHNGYAVLKSSTDSFIHLLSVHDPERLHSRSFHWVLCEEGVNEDALPIIASVERLLLPDEELKDSEELDDFLNSFKIVTPVVKPLCNV